MENKENNQNRIVCDVLEYYLNMCGISGNCGIEADNIDDLLSFVLEPAGVMYETVDLSDPFWKNSASYVLGFLENGDPILISPALFGYKYYDPKTGKTGRLSDNTKYQNKGYALYRPIDASGKLSIKDFLSYVIKLIPFKFWGVIVALSCFAALLNLCVPALSLSVLKDLVPEGSAAVPMIASLSVLYLGIALLRSVVAALKKYTAERYSLNIVKQSQAAVIARILNMPISFFGKNLRGHIATIVKNTRELSVIVVEMLFGVAVSLLFSLMNIPQMIWISGPLATSGILLIIVQVAFRIYTASVASRYHKMEIAEESNLRSSIFITLKGIQVIKTSGAEDRVFESWSEVFRRKLKYAFDQPLAAKLSAVVVPSLSTAVLYLTALAFDVGAEDLIAFTVSYSILYTASTQVSQFVNAYYKAAQYIGLLEKLFKEKPENDTSLKIVKDLRGEICFEDVNFSYDPNEEFHMDKINLLVKPGEVVGITGRSGSGKSTLLSLIIGSRHPLSGTVSIDGSSVDTLNMRFINRKIGYVSQGSHLLPGSIRYNITMGNDSIPDEEIWDALRMASVADVIEALPDGLDSVVSETSGGGFSGGQKQCMLLARALVRKPKLLILDEATSAMDNNTQSAVMQNIYDTNATIIMVAHRLSTIKNCSKIIVMENGQIAENGSYDELMEKQGLFYEIVSAQDAC